MDSSIAKTVAWVANALVFEVDPIVWTEFRLSLDDLSTPLRYPPVEDYSSVKQASETPHKGHPKMFPPVFNEADPRTPWQRFEDLASKVLRTPKTAVDTHRPIHPRKANRS
jgi:hypothetical protein